jgi:hypothetical protein
MNGPRIAGSPPLTDQRHEPSQQPLARVSPARSRRLSRVAGAVSFDPRPVCSRVRRGGSRK